MSDAITFWFARGIGEFLLGVCVLAAFAVIAFGWVAWATWIAPIFKRSPSKTPTEEKS